MFIAFGFSYMSTMWTIEYALKHNSKTLGARCHVIVHTEDITCNAVAMLFDAC